jgi:hypothetical protein
VTPPPDQKLGTQALVLARAQEWLRQSQETFNQKKLQDHRWFQLQFLTGFVCIGLMPSLAAFCGLVLWRHESFSASVVSAAAGALFLDILGFMLAAGKIIIGGRQAPQPLAPQFAEPALVVAPNGSEAALIDRGSEPEAS